MKLECASHERIRTAIGVVAMALGAGCAAPAPATAGGSESAVRPADALVPGDYAAHDTVENAVLNHFKSPVANADAKLTLSKATLDRIQLKETTLEQAVSAGEAKVEGRREAFGEFLALLDTFPFWFNIVTP